MNKETAIVIAFTQKRVPIFKATYTYFESPLLTAGIFLWLKAHQAD